MLCCDLLKQTFNLNNKQLEQFDFYYRFLIEENQKMNLTRLTSLSNVYYKHFYDSLALTKVFDFTQINNLCDVGSGAGFPSFPLKIINPHLNIYIVESSLKKISFLKKLAFCLSLKNIFFFHQRAEHHNPKTQNKGYDCVVTRALGNLSLILKWCFPLIKKKGYFIAMKGKNFAQELEDNQKLLKKLKIDLTTINQLELPSNLGTRANLLFQKK
ncbi:16S rRNA (guanine(527)-N(7))-methyltransferase RsmG [Candidatus Phytoplasma meliae]|uniref:Ribosomal RNA small subunit methyltransferase G n=1 Tax=Candidatus Phytoplasma meliae TaxID=1848402 RepID=A0ABS5CYF9_9MOLU|nr:16S rRNA (guanine(527)-N(7))-methyltransferase RsmG [Candidatus Phytoplasma meliae]MBP5836018.1 16S rRNA (guanine(527)-N(7))-methyltransferase RsmG [Candidatus Phytoplasma meliae]